MVKVTQPKSLKRLKSKHAVSAVISNMILLAAVIAAGFVALTWTVSTSSAYVAQYGASTGSSIEQLRERVAFEYVFYDNNSKSLTAYILNCGKIDNVSIVAAYVSYQSNLIYKKPDGVTLYSLSTTSVAGLNIGKEGNFTLSSPLLNLSSGSSYMIQILTRRGSLFENVFTA